MIPGDTSERCYICGRTPQNIHHCLHGIHRKNADKYGLTVHLCQRCHSLLHDTGLYDLELEQIAQVAFEVEHGHDEFIKIFGKNWL